MRGIRRFLAATAASPVLLVAGLAPVVGSVEAAGLEEFPLAGPRHAKMRQLTRFLDETAQGMVEGANDATRHGTPEEARFLPSIRIFARSARDFRSGVDAHPDTRFDVAGRLSALTEVARALEERLRSARALERTFPNGAR